MLLTDRDDPHRGQSDECVVRHQRDRNVHMKIKAQATDSSEDSPLCVSLALRAWAFRQEASRRAPPRSAVPMVHWPWVERTTESAMARPSPVPATVTVARWNRSKTA